MAASHDYCVPSTQPAEASRNTTESARCVFEVQGALLSECRSEELPTLKNRISRQCRDLLGRDLELCAEGRFLVRVDVRVDDYAVGTLSVPTPDGAAVNTYPLQYLAGAEPTSTTVSICTTLGGKLSTRPIETVNECLNHVKTWIGSLPDFSAEALHKATLRRRYYSSPYVQNQLLASLHPIDTGCFEGEPPSSTMMTLGCLMMKHRTDKGFEHGYFRTYSRLLRPYVTGADADAPNGVRMLEIGYFEGASVKVWREYLPNVEALHVIEKNSGMGLGTKKVLDDEGTTLYSGDQSDASFLEMVVKDGGGEYDLIVDDGSHDPTHQLNSFESLFGSVRPGGLYVVEDTETSYWRDGAGLYDGPFVRPRRHFVREMQAAVDRSVNGLFSGGSGKHGSFPHAKNIASVEFAQNMVIVRKCDRSDEMFRDERREYVFADLVA